MPTKTKIINGVIVSAFPPIARICIGFFLTAILVDYLEVTDFGIWKLALSVFGASWVLQLGMNSLISRVIPYASVKQDFDRIKVLLSSVFFLYCIIGISLTIISLASIQLFFFAYFPEQSSSARQVFIVTAVCYGIWFPFSAYRAVVAGSRWYATNALIETASHIFYCIAVLVSVSFELSVVAIAICSAIRLLFVVFVCFIVSVSRNALFIPKLRQFQLRAILEGLPFSINSTVFSISSFLLTNAIVWMSASLGGADSAAYMAVAMQISMIVAALLSITMVVIKPEVSKLDASGTTETIQAIVINSVRFVLFLCGSFSIYIAFEIQTILKFWIHKSEYYFLSEIVPFLLLAQTSWVLMQVVYYVANGLGRHKIIAFVSVVTLFISIVSGYILSLVLDDLLLSLSIAFAASLSVNTFIVLPLFLKKVLQINLFHDLKWLLKIVLALGILTMFAVSKKLDLFFIEIDFITHSMVFVLLVFICGYFIAANSNERQLLKTSILRVASK
jgi:O-antigen/teichoic acid export membrane protein